MTDIDIVAELRRLYEAAPQGKWTCEGPDFHGYRIFSADEKVLNHTLTEAGVTAELIVAMHNHLPALLDAVEAWRAHEAHMARRDIDDAPDEDSWLAEWEVLNDRACTALEALKQDGEG